MGHLAPDSAEAAQADHEASPQARAADRQACRRVSPQETALSQRFADDPVLLAQVCRRVALARARPPGAADVAEPDAWRQVLLEAVPNRAPRPHVLRLLLGPDDLRKARIRRDEGGLLLDRERIQLLDPCDRDVFGGLAQLVPGEVVVDLAGAEDEPPHLLLVDGRVVEDRLKAAFGEVG